MKKLCYWIPMIFCIYSQAQSVGVGTSTAHSSALLDLTSNNKGLLIPRMSSFNRVSIASPANGLMVYDTDLNRFYLFQNDSWRYVIHNSYWQESSTRNWVYNTSDSVGIGTSSPTQRLDVNGNIRSRDNISADGNISASGNIGSGSLSTSGGLIVAGNSVLSGNITTNGTTTANGAINTEGPLNIDNSGATLQLKSSAVNKGFFQLSSDNLRLGTNSGNTLGNVIFRLNGNDRTVMYPNGDINIEGKIMNQSETGTNNLLPHAYGRVAGNGSIVSGTGNFTVTKGGLGEYFIYSTGITSTSTAIVTSQWAASLPSVSTYSGYILVLQYYVPNANWSDLPFHFVIYK